MIKKIIKEIKNTAKANNVNGLLLGIVLLIISIPACITYLFLSIKNKYIEKTKNKKFYKKEIKGKIEEVTMLKMPENIERTDEIYLLDNHTGEVITLREGIDYRIVNN